MIWVMAISSLAEALRLEIKMSKIKEKIVYGVIKMVWENLAEWAIANEGRACPEDESDQ